MRRGPSLVLFIVTLLSFLGLVSGAATSTPSPSAQAQIPKTTPERLDSLEERTKELEGEIDHATLKNDYIQQIQRQYETYYERAFSTQIQILSILGIILTVLLFLAGRFGLNIFDRQIQLQLKSATDTLRSEFEIRLAEQLRSLTENNAAQLKELEAGLKSTIAVLEETVQLRSDFQFRFSLGTSALLDEALESAVNRFREALTIYVKGKDRDVVPRSGGVTTLRLLFFTMNKQGEAEFAERAKQELENIIYQDLDQELLQTAQHLPPLLPLLKK
jgi:hypothetical protein